MTATTATITTEALDLATVTRDARRAEADAAEAAQVAAAAAVEAARQRSAADLQRQQQRRAWAGQVLRDRETARATASTAVASARARFVDAVRTGEGVLLAYHTVVESVAGAWALDAAAFSAAGYLPALGKPDRQRLRIPPIMPAFSVAPFGDLLQTALRQIEAEAIDRAQDETMRGLRAINDETGGEA